MTEDQLRSLDVGDFFNSPMRAVSAVVRREASADDVALALSPPSLWGMLRMRLPRVLVMLVSVAWMGWYDAAHLSVFTDGVLAGIIVSIATVSLSSGVRAHLDALTVHHEAQKRVLDAVERARRVREATAASE